MTKDMRSIPCPARCETSGAALSWGCRRGSRGGAQTLELRCDSAIPPTAIHGRPYKQSTKRQTRDGMLKAQLKAVERVQ